MGGPQITAADRSLRRVWRISTSFLLDRGLGRQRDPKGSVKSFSTRPVRPGGRASFISFGVEVGDHGHARYR